MKHSRQLYAECLNAVLLLIVACGLMAMGGCVNYGQSVMVSKGRAGAVQAVFGADAEFCKITTTEGVAITDQDRQAFASFCGGE